MPTSILGLIEDIFTSRDTKKVGSSFINFKTTLETIAKTHSDNSTLNAAELKKKVLPLIKTNGTWAMPFINLFNARFYKNPSEEYKPIIAEMQETVDKLMAFIGNQGPIYYNILSYSDNNNTVRKTSDGTNISKKTFINAIPEPPRIIINLESKFKEELVNPEKPIVDPKANIENVTTTTTDPTKDKIIFTNPNIKLEGFNSLQTKWLEGLDKDDYQELINILNYFESLKDSTTNKKLYNELLIALSSLDLSPEDVEIDLSTTDGIKTRIIQALVNTSLDLSGVREAKKPIDTVNAKLNVLIQTLTGDENKSIYDDDLETIFPC